MKQEHSIGDFVTYKQNGICMISAIVKRDFAGMGEKEYYELRPVYDEKTVLFIPKDFGTLTDTMRHILTKDEIDKIIDETEMNDIVWVEDSKERAKIFEDIISKGDRRRILGIIKTLSLHKTELERKQKKMYASDGKILALAEKIITEEFSFVLKIDRSDVIDYINEKLGYDKNPELS